MNSKKTADRRLAEDILNGDRHAFGQFIKNTEGLVAQIIFRMIKTQEERKDLAQEVYLKAYHSLSKFNFQSKLSTWVGQIAYNTCINHLKKKKAELLDDDLEFFTSSDDDLLFSSIRNKELNKILETAMNELSPLYKTILSLYHQKELSYQEIGEITGLPEGTLKSYLFRARRRMRDSLLKKYQKEDL